MKKAIRIEKIITVVLCFATLLTLVAFAPNAESAKTSEVTTQIKMGGEAEEISFAELFDDESVIVFSASESGAQKIAYQLQNNYLYKIGFDGDTVKDTKAEAAVEIQIGSADRPLINALRAEAEKRENAVYSWGYAYSDGKFAFYYNSKTTFDWIVDEFYERFIADGKFTVYEGLFEVYTKTQAEIDRENEERAEAERQKLLDELRAEIDGFADELFGEAELMPTDSYDYPPYDLTTAEHPRLLVNANTLPAIKALLSKDSTYEEYAEMREQFWEYADAKGVTGIFIEIGNPILYKNGTPDDPSDDYYLKNKFDREILCQVEAKALAYLITGDEIYGLEAIRAAKNMMLTMRYWDDKQQDTYWGASMTAYTISHVYDWCYDLLTERDMAHIIGGVRTLLLTQLEFHYPPSNMSGVSGHGTGRQMLADYLSLAIAFANERPDWWAFVGGRVYEEFIPVLNEMYSSGFVSQGTYYGTRKWGWHLLSMYILDAYGDTTSIDRDLSNTAYTTAALILPNGNFLQTGDNSGWMNHRPEGDPTVGAYWMLYSAGLTKDPAFLELAKECSENYTKLDLNEIRLTPTMYPILIAQCLDATENEIVDLPTIVYNGHPGGQTVIKSSLDEDAAFVFMKILDKTMANHEHSSSGTFQIYYKGLLACESGYYEGVLYGDEHHKYYLTATVAHNGMLVYDADYRDTLPEAQRKYYSGSQVRLNEAGTMDKWNSGLYDVATILGHAEGYRQDGTSKFAYISGNTTNAYVADTVDYVKRSMLTVMTESEDVPMLFFVYDDVTSDNENAIKKFLLHTVNEPKIDGNTVTVTQDEGKLVLTSLLGADNIEGIGGAGKGFWVGESGTNGYNVADDVKNGHEDSLWGRVEINASGENTDKMLNVMYVTDKNGTASITPTLIESDKFAGAKMDNVVGLFMKSRSGEAEAFSFTAEGEGLTEYYICGLGTGNWEIKVNGEKLGKVYATRESGMIYFKAPAGDVELTPLGIEKTYTINYELAGGYFSGKAPASYTVGKGVKAIPTPTHDRGNFLGWYTDETFTNPISEISAECEGEFTLYAKWDRLPSIYVDTDCENAKGVEGWSGKTEAMKVDDRTVIKWTPAEGNKIHTSDAADGYGLFFGNQKSVSFSVTIAKDATADAIASNFRIYGPGSKELCIFTTDAEGNVRLGGKSGTPILTLTSEFTTLNIVLDFEFETVTAYLEDGTAASVSVKSPDKNYKTLEEWRLSFGANWKYIFNWRAAAAGVLYVDRIYIAEGNLFESSDVVKYPIVYEIGGGSFDGAYATTYVEGVGLPTLPTPTMEGVEFLGWYTDASLTTQVTEISADSTGKVTLFAKWKMPPAVYVDYDCSDVKINGMSGAWSGTAEAVTLGDATVIKWSPASGNKVHCTVGDAGYGIMYADEHKVSFSVTLARDSEAAVVTGTFRLTHPNGGTALNIFIIDADGNVRLGGTKGAIIETLTTELKTINVLLDFDAEMLTAYRADGAMLEYSLAGFDSAKYDSLNAWRLDFGSSKNLFNWRADTAGVLYVDRIYVAEGNRFESSDVVKYPISYELGGGSLEGTYSSSYVGGVGLKTLPTPTLEGSEFLGWYADAAFTTPVTEISEESIGAVTLYAKWKMPPAVYVDYDCSDVKINGMNGAWSGTAEVTALGDATVIKWSPASGNKVHCTVGEDSYGIMYADEHKVSFSVTLARDSEAAVATGTFRIAHPNGGTALNIFIIDADGNVRLGKSGGEIIETLTTELKTVNITLDFDAEKLTAYKADGSTAEYSLAGFDSEKYSSLNEWRLDFGSSTNYFNWRAGTAGVLYVDRIYIAEGDIFN